MFPLKDLGGIKRRILDGIGKKRLTNFGETGTKFVEGIRETQSELGKKHEENLRNNV